MSADGGEPWGPERALRYALNLLSRRDWGRAELRGRLERKPIPEDVREDVLARLDEWGYLDDARVAQAVVRLKGEARGWLALRRELERRGVPEAERDAALAPLDEAQQADAAAALLRKHAWRFDSGDARKDRAKAARFLARRGFDGDAARRAVDAVWSTGNAEDAQPLE